VILTELRVPLNHVKTLPAAKFLHRAQIDSLYPHPAVCQLSMPAGRFKGRLETSVRLPGAFPAAAHASSPGAPVDAAGQDVQFTVLFQQLDVQAVAHFLPGTGLASPAA
jgi:hypothetical protein